MSNPQTMAALIAAIIAMLTALTAYIQLQITNHAVVKNTESAARHEAQLEVVTAAQQPPVAVTAPIAVVPPPVEEKP